MYIHYFSVSHIYLLSQIISTVLSFQKSERRTAGDGAGGRVQQCGGVLGVEHVPVGVQDAGEEGGVVGAGGNVRVGGGRVARVEVVRGAHHHRVAHPAKGLGFRII